MGFNRPFAFPPNVTLGLEDGRFAPQVIVSEITAQGFKWKSPGPKIERTIELTWTARGVSHEAVWRKTEKK